MNNEKDDAKDLETDARPGRNTFDRGQPVRISSSDEQEIIHTHGDGTVTRISMNEKMGNLPNIQIGNSNVMVIGGASYSGESKSKKEKKSSKFDSSEVPNRNITDADLDIVSSEIGKEYKRFMRYLGLTDIQIEQLYMDYKDEGTYEVIYQSLRKWQKLGEANMTTLFKALHKVDCTNAIQKLRIM